MVVLVFDSRDGSTTTTANGSTSECCRPNNPKELCAVARMEPGMVSTLTRYRVAGGIGAFDLGKLRQDALHGVSQQERPLVWRLLLGVVGPEPSTWLACLSEKRALYHGYRSGFDGYFDRTNLLQLDAEPHQVQQDMALMNEIAKDVSRTQSNTVFFSIDGEAQQWMLHILFIYAKRNPELGYMQGMNEILAPVVYTFGTDANESWAREAEADAFFAFTVIMASVAPLYKSSPRDPSRTGIDMQLLRLAMLLRQHDAPLWLHLNSIGLSPDYYSFRWYMTLLTREFPLEGTQRLWDALLADPKRFSFLHYLSCAMIRLQRQALLREGFTDALKRLQTLPGVNVAAVCQHAQSLRETDRRIDQQRRHAQPLQRASSSYSYSSSATDSINGEH